MEGKLWLTAVKLYERVFNQLWPGISHLDRLDGLAVRPVAWWLARDINSICYIRSGSVMNLDQTLAELTSLPVADRLRVVESLWLSIDADAPVSISPEQRAEIDRRVEAHERNPDELLTWDQVLDQLRDRK